VRVLLRGLSLSPLSGSGGGRGIASQGEVSSPVGDREQDWRGGFGVCALLCGFRPGGDLASIALVVALVELIAGNYICLDEER